jgi:predicted AAA+ superfamily ATPase
MENILREILSSWLAREIPRLIERDYPTEASKSIVAIIGPRRAGKTYFMFQIAKNLLSKGFLKENIAYLDFEDLRLKNLTSKHYSMFIKVLHELFTEKEGKIVLLLDEVQNLSEWGGWVRSLHNTNNYFIFISGSSSKLSLREVPTQLRGRYITRLILPLSFKEFLKFKGFEVKYLASPEVKGMLLQRLREYLNFGGFPEVVLEESRERKLELLRAYRETIFYRDIVERFKVRDISSLETFLRLLEENFGKYFSISKVERYFKSIGVKKSKRTLRNYLKYFESSFFIFSVEKFSLKTKERVLQPKKIYSIDTGFYSLVPKISEEYGGRIENLVARKLFERKFYEIDFDFFYFKDYAGREVDFLIKKGLRIDELIQVTFASSIGEIEKEKLKVLINVSNNLKCNKLTVITWDLELIKEIDGKQVKFIPLWKWLME